MAAEPARIAASPIAPLALGAGALAACTTVALVDPGEPGRYPVCPFLALTGRWCPGCGSLRGMNALLTGAPLEALGFNALMVLALPFVLYSYAAWASPLLGGPRLRRLHVPAPAIWGLLAVVIVFWIARNIPVAPFTALAP